VADFALAEAENAGGTHREGWLAFRNATWLLDRLHASLALDRAPSIDPPYSHTAAAASNGVPVRARHFSGSARPQYQQVVYFEPGW